MTDDSGSVVASEQSIVNGDALGRDVARDNSRLF